MIEKFEFWRWKDFCFRVKRLQSLQQQDLQRLDVKVDLDFVKEKKIVSLKLYFVTADQVKSLIY